MTLDPLAKLDADIAARRAKRIKDNHKHDHQLRWLFAVAAAIGVAGFFLLLVANDMETSDDNKETVEGLGAGALIGGGATAFASGWKLNDNKERSNDVTLGGGNAQRFSCSYLGGHVAYPDPLTGCKLLFTKNEVAIENSNGALVARYDMTDVTHLRVETSEAATKRVTATRVLALGVFALAVKKSKPGSVLVSLETLDGEMAFEKAKANPVDVRRELARPIAQIGSR